jgi:DNA-binding GntR family transcriptional regulator
MTADASKGPARSDARLGPLAYRHIKEALLDGVHPCGARLGVEAIAAELGISRQPVMDAMRRLQTEGFVEVVPQVGCRVVDPDPAEVEDFFRLLAATEGTFAELAARRRTADEAQALVALAADSGIGPRTPAARAARAYRAHNRAFHLRIHQLARAPMIHAIGAALWDRSDFLINASVGGLSFAIRAHDAVTEHAALAQAIAQGDAEGARRAMQQHILAFAKATHDAPADPAPPTRRTRRR